MTNESMMGKEIIKEDNKNKIVKKANGNIIMMEISGL